MAGWLGLVAVAGGGGWVLEGCVRWTPASGPNSGVSGGGQVRGDRDGGEGNYRSGIALGTLAVIAVVTESCRSEGWEEESA
jgi:hypothetical protein